MKRDDELNEKESTEDSLKNKKKKGEGNKFDKIWKENIFKLFIPLLDRHFNLKLRKHKELTPKFQVTIEREVDFLRLVEDTNGNEFILHIEIQTTYEENLIFRLKEYEALISRRYKLPVRTYVFYLGLDYKRIKTELPSEIVFSAFQLMPFCQIPYELFIESDNPEEIIIAVLSDLKDKVPKEIIKEILMKLETKVQTKASLNKYVVQLQVLSQLRNLDMEVKQIANNMSIFPDIRKNAAVAPIIQAIEEEKRAVMEKIKVIKEKNKAIVQKNKAIEEKNKAIVEKKRAVVEKNSALEKEMKAFKRKTVKTLLEIGTFSTEEIARKTETSIDTVLKIKKETGL